VTLRRASKPAPLLLAASLTVLEGVVLLAYAVLEAVNVSADRAAVGVTTSVFFAGYGGVLVLCAWSVTRGHSWARSPIVLAQLIQLGVAWSFRGGGTTLLAVAIAAIAVLVLVGLLSPPSVAALADRDDRADHDDIGDRGDLA
jgi:uncharacterized membrane protein